MQIDSILPAGYTIYNILIAKEVEKCFWRTREYCRDKPDILPAVHY